ncbi:DUF6397 family protein [Streptomyces sp. NPDC050856]|uniref:DUF6397 family protein n=1 Tax=Streptomyces sp. NPDC050856 TaxID=3154939 RepID=UPI003402008B
MTARDAAGTVALGRAAQELRLERGELDLAVRLGLVRTVPGETGGRRRVARAEIDRLRAGPDFPDGLRERVRTVGTAEAAELASITADRFTRLARTGHFSPVAFHLNRYRAVVWRYVAGEVSEFAREHPELLSGRLPRAVRARLDAGDDVRPRNWRARRLALLLRQAEDPWAGAAAIASLLDPVQLAEVVDDPYERAHLARLRPEPPYGRTDSARAREVADRLLLADDPDEILWHRVSLALALDEARALRPAPRPAGGHRSRDGERPYGCRPVSGRRGPGRAGCSAAWGCGDGRLPRESPTGVGVAGASASGAGRQGEPRPMTQRSGARDRPRPRPRPRRRVARPAAGTRARRGGGGNAPLCPPARTAPRPPRTPLPRSACRRGRRPPRHGST